MQTIKKMIIAIVVFLMVACLLLIHYLVYLWDKAKKIASALVRLIFMLLITPRIAWLSRSKVKKLYFEGIIDVVFEALEEVWETQEKIFKNKTNITMKKFVMYAGSLLAVFVMSFYLGHQVARYLPSAVAPFVEEYTAWAFVALYAVPFWLVLWQKKEG